MHESATLVKFYGLGGIGLPGTFFSDPADANRATAEAMEGPTGKKLTDRQNEVKRLIIRMVNFVIEQAIAKGVLPKGTDVTFKVQVPELLIKDLVKAATTLQGVSRFAGDRRGPRLDARRDGRARHARCAHADRRRG
jgi:hypothetical protein